jgi:hypothetical protein
LARTFLDSENRTYPQFSGMSQASFEPTQGA